MNTTQLKTRNSLSSVVGFDPIKDVSKESIVMLSGVTSIKNSTFGLLKPGKLNAPSVVPPVAAPAAAVFALESPGPCGCAAVAASVDAVLLFAGRTGRDIALIAIGNGCTCILAPGKNGMPNMDG